MTGQGRRLDIAAVHRLLRQSVHCGVKASRLLAHVPALVELLYPASAYPHLSAELRAFEAQCLIQDAVGAIGGKRGKALAVILRLDPGTRDRKLIDRRRIAAEYLDLTSEATFRQRHESLLLSDLAFEVHEQWVRRREHSADGAQRGCTGRGDWAAAS